MTLFGRLATCLVISSITDEFGVSNTVIGASLTGMWLTYGLTQFPSGVLGEWGIILVALGGTAVTGLITPVAVAWVGVTYGWRLATAVEIPAFVLFALSVRPTEPRRPELPLRERFQLRSLLELLSRPMIAFTPVRRHRRARR